MQDTLRVLESSFSVRLLHPKCVKERYRRFFLLLLDCTPGTAPTRPHTHTKTDCQLLAQYADGQFQDLNV